MRSTALLPGGAVAKLTFLKVVISLEVLIPAALYVSVILTFARLHRRLGICRHVRAAADSGRHVSCGADAVHGPWRSWWDASRSMSGRGAYRNLHEMADRAATLLDVDAMQAGSFYVSQHGARVVFLTHRNGPGTPARDVFVKLAYSDHDEIISGRLASAVPSGIANGGSDVNLTDANLYELNHAPGKADEILHVQAMTVDPNSRGATPGRIQQRCGEHRTDRKVRLQRGYRGAAVAPLDAALHDTAWIAWHPAQPHQATAEPEPDLRQGLRGVFRVLPALHLRAHMGAARHHCRVPPGSGGRLGYWACC